MANESEKKMNFIFDGAYKVLLSDLVEQAIPVDGYSYPGVMESTGVKLDNLQGLVTNLLEALAGTVFTPEQILSVLQVRVIDINDLPYDYREGLDSIPFVPKITVER